MSGETRKGGEAAWTWQSRRAPTHQWIPFSIMCVEQEIKTHTQRVKAGELVFYGQACPGCGGQEGFHMHDRRPRTFRIVVEGSVKRLCSWILRWKCVACGKRFTDYPPFRGPAQAVRQAAGMREGEGIPGHGDVLSPGGRPSGEADPVRGAAGKPHRGRERARWRLSTQYRLAVVVVAGQPGEHDAGSRPVDPRESPRQYAAPRTVATACPDVSLRGTPADASAGSAVPGDRALVPGAVPAGNIPPLCNGSWLELS